MRYSIDGLARAAAHADRGDRIGWSERLELALVAAFAFLLRWRLLRDQILADDEWHALRSAVGASYRDLYLDLQEAATPGLHLLFKLLHDTVGLTELRMRAPMFVAGVAAVIVFPWLVAPWVDRHGRRIFALLLAISPLLVYFSRYARPYSVSLFCCFVGVVAFLRWWKGDGRRWAVLYVACCTLGILFHPAFAPTLLSPLILAFAALVRRRLSATREPARLASLAVVAAATALALGAAIGPALWFDWGALAGRLGNPRADLETLRFAAELASGTSSRTAQLAAATLAVWGAAILSRQASRVALATAGVAVATLAPSLLSTADSVRIPIVFLRYSLWLLPALLLLVAIGAGRLALWVERRWAATGGLAVAVVGAAVAYAIGPLPATLRSPSSWTSHAIFTYALDGDSPFSYEADLRPTRLPAFYGELALLPRGSVRIVEAPWFYEWHNNPLPFYQRVHGQSVVAGMLGGLCPQPAAILSLPSGATDLRLRNAVELARPETLRYHPVDYLVLHVDLKREVPRAGRDVARTPGNNLPLSIVASCLPAIVAAYGEPLRRDRDLLVWDLRPFSAVTGGPSDRRPIGR